MKKITLAIFAIAMMFQGSDLFAQGKYGADSAQCLLNLSYYKEYFKQKSYDEAVTNWRKAYEICPVTANQNMIIDGTVLMRRLIAQNAKNPAYKAALIDTLMTLHDARINNYPKYAVTARNNKGLDLINYCKSDEAALLKSLKDIMEANAGATSAAILINEMNLASSLFANGGIEAEEVIALYEKIQDCLEKAPIKTDADKERISKVKGDIEGLFATSNVASCDNLIELFTPRYNANPENLELATNIVKMMSRADDCQNNDLYLRAATTMYKLDPSYSSAYFLFRLNAAQGNIDEALKYVDEAIAYTESDNLIDAKYSNEAAAFCFKNNRFAKAVDYALGVTALTDEPHVLAQTYMLVGEIWGASNCGGDEINRRASYWVAADYMAKAKASDPSLTEEANKFIAGYAKYFPSQADAFMYGFTDGQSYTISCNGMRATTVVRTQK